MPKHHHARARAGIALALVATAVLGLDTRSSSAATTGVGRLAVSVSGLPSGVRASVIVAGPNGFRSLVRRSRLLSALRPGTYEVSIRPVRLGASQRAVPAGSTAYALRAKMHAIVDARGLTRVNARYTVIRSARVQTLSVPVVGVRGKAADPTAITLRAAGHPPVGAVLVQPPSAVLPAGLVHRVTAVAVSGTRATLTLKAVSLQEAYPELDITTTVALSPEPAGSRTVRRSRGAYAAAAGPVDLSIGGDVFRCGVPFGAGYAFSDRQSLSVQANVDLHFPLVGQPHGSLSATVAGSRSIAFKLPAGEHCDGSLTEPSLQAFIPGTPIPVYAQLGETASLQISQDLAASASIGLSVTAGMSFVGNHATPIVAIHPSGSASITGAGQLSIGPTVELGVGAASINAHVDLAPAFAFSAGSGGCELDLQTSVGVGVTFGFFQANCPPRLRSRSTNAPPARA